MLGVIFFETIYYACVFLVVYVYGFENRKENINFHTIHVLVNDKKRLLSLLNWTTNIQYYCAIIDNNSIYSHNTLENVFNIKGRKKGRLKNEKYCTMSIYIQSYLINIFQIQAFIVDCGEVHLHMLFI